MFLHLGFMKPNHKLIMKKSYYFIISLVLLSVVNSLFAQQTSGIVKYKGAINEEFRKSFIEDFKNKDVAPDIRKGVVEMYLNAQEDTYELHFKNQESYFHYMKELENETGKGLKMGSKAGTNEFYVNLTDKKIIEKNSVLGFLEYSGIQWDVKNVTKNIGDYKCFKAVETEKNFTRSGAIKEEQVVAWFTPDIPLQFGPKNYNGLPGLILQIDKEKFSILATQVILNPDEKIEIEAVKKDEKIPSRQEAYQIANEYYKDAYGN